MFHISVGLAALWNDKKYLVKASVCVFFSFRFAYKCIFKGFSIICLFLFFCMFMLFVRYLVDKCMCTFKPLLACMFLLGMVFACFYLSQLTSTCLVLPVSARLFLHFLVRLNAILTPGSRQPMPLSFVYSVCPSQ